MSTKRAVTVCERCEATKWLWLTDREIVRCAGCGFERARTETDYEEFEQALETAYIKHKQEAAARN